MQLRNELGIRAEVYKADPLIPELPSSGAGSGPGCSAYDQPTC